MHRAKAAINVIAPIGQQNFGAWLLRGGNKSKLTNELVAASSVKLYNSAAAEPFLNGSSTSYVEEMYNAWLKDPTSVHAVSFFSRKIQKSFIREGFVYLKR